MNDYQFASDASLMANLFLTSIVRDTSIQEFSETQPFVALANVLTRLAKSHSEVGIKTVASKYGAVLSWVEAVQYELRYHA